MRCDNCQGACEPAFTLLAHPPSDEAIAVDFCCISCLQAWTSNYDTELEQWEWGVDDGLAEVAPAATR